MIQFPTFHDRLLGLNKCLPKPLELPAGLSDLITDIDSRRDPKNTIVSLFQDEGCGSGDATPPTYRTFLNNSCSLLGLAWQYDVKRDVLAADFIWRRYDPRSSQALLNALVENDPLPTDNVGWPTDKSIGYDTNTVDPWRLALDALISKPENYPLTWKLRLLDDTKGGNLCPVPGAILWHGTVLDEMDQSHYVVIKYHPTFSMPGPLASFVIYAFNADGHFTCGELMTDSYRCVITPKITSSPSQKSLDFSWSNGKHGSMSLAANRFIFQSASTYHGDYLGTILFNTAAD